MDIKLEKKPWYIRYRYYLIGGILFVAFLIYVIILEDFYNLFICRRFRG